MPHYPVRYIIFRLTISFPFKKMLFLRQVSPIYRLNKPPLPIGMKIALFTYNRKVRLRFCLSVLINLSFIAVRAYQSVHWMVTSYFVAWRKPQVSFLLTFVSPLPSRTIGLKIGLGLFAHPTFSLHLWITFLCNKPNLQRSEASWLLPVLLY